MISSRAASYSPTQWSRSARLACTSGLAPLISCSKSAYSICWEPAAVPASSARDVTAPPRTRDAANTKAAAFFSALPCRPGICLLCRPKAFLLRRPRASLPCISRPSQSSRQPPDTGMPGMVSYLCFSCLSFSANLLSMIHPSTPVNPNRLQAPRVRQPVHGPPVILLGLSQL